MALTLYAGPTRLGTLTCTSMDWPRTFYDFESAPEFEGFRDVLDLRGSPEPSSQAKGAAEVMDLSVVDDDGSSARLRFISIDGNKAVIRQGFIREDAPRPAEGMAALPRTRFIIAALVPLAGICLLLLFGEAYPQAPPAYLSGIFGLAMLSAWILPGVIAGRAVMHHRFTVGLVVAIAGWVAGFVGGIVFFLVLCLIRAPETQSGQGVGILLFLLLLFGIVTSPISGVTAVLSGRLATGRQRKEVAGTLKSDREPAHGN